MYQYINQYSTSIFSENVTKTPVLWCFQRIQKWNITLKLVQKNLNYIYILVAKQPSRHAIFREYLLSVPSALQCTGHPGIIQGKLYRKRFFKKFSMNGKAIFVLKVYDLIMANIDLSTNCSNHEIMFPEYSMNIPRMSVSKLFQEYPRNIIKL